MGLKAVPSANTTLPANASTAGKMAISVQGH